MLRLVPDDTKIPFMGARRLTFPISMALASATIAIWLTMGINCGMDFTGGNLVEVRHKVGPAGLAEVSRKFVGCGRCGEWGHRRALCPYTPRGYLQREAFHD